MMEDKTAKVLWQNYQFLTKEMLKFLQKQEMELFNELMNQRDQLQTLIEHTPDEGFKASSAGRSLLNEIKQDNELLNQSFQRLFNRRKRFRQVSDVYRGVGVSPVSRRNWQR